MDYIFYEPTIQGETKVVDGKLVSLEPTDSTLPKLGKWDYIDRASGEIVLNAEYEFTGDENFGTASTNESSSIFFCTNIVSNIETSFSPVCTHFEGRVGTVLGERFIATNSSQGYVYIGALKSEFPTVEALKNYFKQQKENSTPVVVRLKVVPITQQLTPSQIHAYDNHRRIISLPFAEDKLVLNEDGSGTWIDANFKYIVTGSESWDINHEMTNCIAYFRILPNMKSGGKRECATLQKLSNSNEDREGYFIANSKALYITIPKEKASNVAELKTYLSNLYNSGTPIQFVCESEAPTTTHIPKSICPTIAVNKTNICSAGDAVKPSSFTIVVPTTDDVRKEIAQTLLNGFVNVSDVAKASLLKNGNARIELDITAPAENMSATILTLPAELRPTANRKIQVFVNGVSQLATVKTDGTLLLSAAPSASANIYIKEEYTM